VRLSDKAWTAHEWGVKERTIADCTRGDCSVSEFFTNEAEAWDAVAELSRIEAEHKQLGADEATKRMENALHRARVLRGEAKP
jgi:hypothetical protein